VALFGLLKTLIMGQTSHRPEATRKRKKRTQNHPNGQDSFVDVAVSLRLLFSDRSQSFLPFLFLFSFSFHQVAW